jgi:uncharacterized membrane protein YoaK (UPF0700 family)
VIFGNESISTYSRSNVIIWMTLAFQAGVLNIGGFNGAFGPFGEAIESRRGGYALLALLCLICGMQNATVSTVSRAVVRTTHLTGLTTDLGIGIARVLNKTRLKKIDEDIQANLMRVGIILFFGLGSVLGSLVFLKAGFRGFLLPAFITGCLFGLTFYFQVLRDPKL